MADVDRERSAARIERDIETLAGEGYTLSNEAIRRYAYTPVYRATLDYFAAALRDHMAVEEELETQARRRVRPGRLGRQTRLQAAAAPRQSF